MDVFLVGTKNRVSAQEPPQHTQCYIGKRERKTHDRNQKIDKSVLAESVGLFREHKSAEHKSQKQTSRIAEKNRGGIENEYQKSKQTASHKRGRCCDSWLCHLRNNEYRHQ